MIHYFPNLITICNQLANANKQYKIRIMEDYGLNYDILINNVYHGDIICYGSNYCMWGSNVIHGEHLRGYKVNQMFQKCNITAVVGNVCIMGMGITNIDHFPTSITGDLCVACNNITNIRNLSNMNIGGNINVNDNYDLRYLPHNFNISPDRFSYTGTKLVMNRNLNRLVKLSKF